MKYPIHIQSVSDLITNSSSEVFICQVGTSDTEALKSEIESLINTLMEVLGYVNDDYYTGAVVEIADEDGVIEGWDYKYKKGDILIWSREENSIPWNIMDILGDLDCLPKFEDKVTKIERHHLG